MRVPICIVESPGVHFDVRYSIDPKINVKRVHTTRKHLKRRILVAPTLVQRVRFTGRRRVTCGSMCVVCVAVCVRAGDVIVPLFWAAASVCFLTKHHRYIRGGLECSKRRKQLSRPLCLHTRAVAFKSDFADRIIGVCSLLFDAGVVCTLMLARRTGERER